jgi:hypothetical protein
VAKETEATSAVPNEIVRALPHNSQVTFKGCAGRGWLDARQKAYPLSGKYDEFRARPADHAKALRMIPKVLAPTKDPLFGGKGPLKRLWK